MRTDLNRGAKFILLLAILSCLLSACESPKDACRRACQELDLDFFSYSPAAYDGGDVMIVPPACHCQKADGELAKLW